MIETIPSGTMLNGRYRIERVLGSGGFGHVYLALDIATNQQCAVKEYLVTGTSGQEQLKHEARVLSQLHHPHIPAFIDTFMEQGRYFVVLNYIEGHDLTDLIRRVRQHNQFIPIAQIMQWMLAICDAVMFLHSQHPIIIHRDIKPDNIRITPNGTAVLVDLGNAKAVADGARTLFFIRHQGTPGYAPPEQYPGGVGTDARSDVYALGGTLYFALTGHEPPDVSTRDRLSQQRKPDLPSLQDQLAKNPPPHDASADAWKQFQLGVSKPGKPAPRHSYHLAQLATLQPAQLHQLNAIIQRAMAIKPKERYPQVAEFAADLRKVMATLPPPPQAPGSQSQQSNPSKTQPDLEKAYEQLQATKDQQANQQSVFPAAQPVTTVNCPRCGIQLPDRATFCPRCGAAIGASNAAKPGNIQASSQGPDYRAADEQTLRFNFSGQRAKAYGQQAVSTMQPQSPRGFSSVATVTPAPSTPMDQGDPHVPRSHPFQERVTGGNEQSAAAASINIKIAAFIAAVVILLLILLFILTGH